MIERVASRHELSIVQVRLLGILRDREPAMMELAAHLNLDKSSVTGLVTRAERRGLVARTSSPDDRRAVLVVLTARGGELVQRAAKEIEAEITVLVAPMNETDKKRLSALASQVVLGDAERRLQPILPG